MCWTACDDSRGRLDETLFLVQNSLFGFKIYQNFSRNDLTNVDIESIITTAEQSFIKAGAAGKIVQGDGHVSDCPYHKKQNR